MGGLAGRAGMLVWVGWLAGRAGMVGVGEKNVKHVDSVKFSKLIS